MPASFPPSIESILSDHADALIQDRDVTEQYIHDFDHLWPDLARLMVLAQTVKKTMVRLPAPRPLVNLLREDLKEGHQPAVQAAVRRRRWIWVGTIASILATATGLVMWFYRRGAAGTAASSPSS